jgi:hypothetical protein
MALLRKYKEKREKPITFASKITDEVRVLLLVLLLILLSRACMSELPVTHNYNFLD